jgi:hypothetical protein
MNPAAFKATGRKAFARQGSLETVLNVDFRPTLAFLEPTCVYFPQNTPGILRKISLLTFKNSACEFETPKLKQSLSSCLES